jgi:UDP-N-acetylglucosamine 4-epimerase
LNYQDLENQLSKKQYRWLVTGAAGFIGSHLVERLLKLNQYVVGIDNLITGSESNIKALEYLPNFKSYFKFLKADICDIEAYRADLSKCDFILHQAAVGSVPRSMAEPELFHKSNVDGFFQILNAAREARVKKFVYASSSSVYGDNPTLPKKEESIGEPLSPYAATKYIDEVYASNYARVYGTPAVGLRYFNVFGKRQNPKGAYAAVIPLWIQSMLDGEEVFINGDGKYSRDFCYIENVVQANLLAAMSSEKTNGQVYNIAVGGQTTLLELFEQMKSGVEKLTGKKVSEAKFREFRQGDIPHSLASIDKAKAELGYQPVVAAREGLLETIKGFIS